MCVFGNNYNCIPENFKIDKTMDVPSKGAENQYKFFYLCSQQFTMD